MTTPLQYSNSIFRFGTHFRQYQLLEEIGAGGQGVVWSAIDSANNRIVAIKFSESVDEQEGAQFAIQAQGLLGLNHPYVLPLYDFGTEQDMRFSVSLYAPAGSLQEQIRLGYLSTEGALEKAVKIAQALDYLHAQGIVHRDLKPGNVLMDLNNNIYLADFGLAKLASDSTMALHTGRGTPPYAPPEQHTLAGITAQSDLFSFGVMLFEMFTGKLPWIGEKPLGIQQLYSKEEIPDPRDIKPELPVELVALLRWLTSANPTARPHSASEILDDLFNMFSIQPEKAKSFLFMKVAANISTNAQAILERGLSNWQPTVSTIQLSLTKFAYVNLSQKQAAAKKAGELKRFMLQNALLYGHEDDYWWNQNSELQIRFDIAASLISKTNEPLTSRVLGHLNKDNTLHHGSVQIPSTFWDTLLAIAETTSNSQLSQTALTTLKVLPAPQQDWQEIAFGSDLDQRLGELAFQKPEAGQVIGQIKSKTALKVLLEHANQEETYPILLNVQKAAGSLPSGLSLPLRANLIIDFLSGYLFETRLSLLATFVFIFSGVALAFGLQVYLTYRLPNFLDTTRIIISLERGVFMGAVFGFGIMTIRALMTLPFWKSNALKTLFATLLGSALLSGALYVYDILFLGTSPSGFLLLAGCALISLGFSLGGLSRSKLLKAMIAFLTIFTALAGSWFWHASFASSPFTLSPLFFYDYGWATPKILGLIALVSLPMALFANLGEISPPAQ